MDIFSQKLSNPNPHFIRGNAVFCVGEDGIMRKYLIVMEDEEKEMNQQEERIKKEGRDIVLHGKDWKRMEEPEEEEDIFDGRYRFGKVDIIRPLTPSSMTLRERIQDWFNNIRMPPATIKFQQVICWNHVSAALTQQGQLYIYGRNEYGYEHAWDNFWTLIPHFSSPDVQSSVGVGKSSGAVFSLGSMLSYKRYNSNIPIDGLVELSDRV
ncbi:MAG: hypothetical protein EZS28_001947 [Streblomastix strix]|uniref:Uncharacterized protein n=1 Tax=Streblomastix strix TaxID=222440 RepID=A0A5J4X5L1_9EUKA|nr:MAG: hypothetical protein EZS28_001947 [Streblomastix strix]